MSEIERTDLAGERTELAAERTQLAWWRTGLTAIAVGIGVGRILPMLDPSVAAWPYLSLGVAFVLYGIVLMVFGNRHGDGVLRATGPIGSKVVSRIGIVLGVATALIILFAR